jgi:predicted amidophosphoribosyltransferase
MGELPGMILLGVVCLGLLGALIVAIGRLCTCGSRRRLEKYQSGCCMGCGYDIRENPRRCPECGSDLIAQGVEFWGQGN